MDPVIQSFLLRLSNTFVVCLDILEIHSTCSFRQKRFLKKKKKQEQKTGQKIYANSLWNLRLRGSHHMHIFYVVISKYAHPHQTMGEDTM